VIRPKHNTEYNYLLRGTKLHRLALMNSEPGLTGRLGSPIRDLAHGPLVRQTRNRGNNDHAGVGRFAQEWYKEGGHEVDTGDVDYGVSVSVPMRQAGSAGALNKAFGECSRCGKHKPGSLAGGKCRWRETYWS
jgi:hypothetical protein